MFYRKRYKELEKKYANLLSRVDSFNSDTSRILNEVHKLKVDISKTDRKISHVDKKINPPYQKGDFIGGDKNKIVISCSFEQIDSDSCCCNFGWVASYFNKKTNKVETHNVI